MTSGWIMDHAFNDPNIDDSCPVCGVPLADHDPDPIGAGLTQYTCPEEKP